MRSCPELCGGRKCLAKTAYRPKSCRLAVCEYGIDAWLLRGDRKATQHGIANTRKFDASWGPSGHITSRRCARGG